MTISGETKATLIAVAVAILIIFIAVGPARCSRRLNQWSAEAYGTDYFVVQYAQDGSIISMKYMFATKPSDVLIDDRESNVEKWEDIAGACAVLHVDPPDTIRRLRELGF